MDGGNAMSPEELDGIREGYWGRAGSAQESMVRKLFAHIDFQAEQIASLEEHERQTHEILGGILGRDTSLEAGARWAMEQIAAKDNRIQQLRKTLENLRRYGLDRDAEICILKTEVCAAQKNIKRRDDDIAGLMEELAKWQRIAIKQRAWSMFIEDELDAIPQEKSYSDYVAQYERKATSELSTQIKQDTSYLSRPESDYLSWVQAYYRDLGEEVAMQRARAALEAQPREMAAQSH